MPKSEYMKVHIDKIPEDIIHKYDLTTIQDKNGHAHFKMYKGMYGLKQAVILMYDQLKVNLAPHGCYPIANTVGMWKHKSMPIQILPLC